MLVVPIPHCPMTPRCRSLRTNEEEDKAQSAKTVLVVCIYLSVGDVHRYFSILTIIFSISWVVYCLPVYCLPVTHFFKFYKWS